MALCQHEGLDTKVPHPPPYPPPAHGPDAEIPEPPWKKQKQINEEKQKKVEQEKLEQEKKEQEKLEKEKLEQQKKKQKANERFFSKQQQQQQQQQQDAKQPLDEMALLDNLAEQLHQSEKEVRRLQGDNAKLQKQLEAKQQEQIAVALLLESQRRQPPLISLRIRIGQMQSGARLPRQVMSLGTMGCLPA